MLIDTYKRKIDYLRISVTDRCNLRCIYCMPECGILQRAPSEMLTFEEITRIAKLGIGLGINKIKITGGEPLVRKDLPKLLHSLSSLAGLKDLSLTTNGILLQKYIRELKETGLRRMNISIDTLDERKFRYITRFGKLEDVLKGIDAALRHNFLIKLNVVILKGLNDSEILSFARFAQSRQIIVRFIELMPMVNNSVLSQDLYMPCGQIQDRLSALGVLKPILLEGLGNGPAEYYRIEEASLIVGFISPISCKFCFACNRLRLTADGLLMPCLGSKSGLDLKKPLRNNAEEKALNLLKRAIFLKPEGHNFICLKRSDDLNRGFLTGQAFSTQREYLMSQIGG